MALGGESLLWLRLFPCLTAIATIAPFFLLSRDLRLHPAEANLAFFFVAVNAYLITYAQYLRMYALLQFFSVCSLWLLARFLRGQGRRPALALFVCNLLLVYTHYWGWVLVATELLYVFWQGAGRRWVFAGLVGVLGLSFAPWAYAVVTTAIEAGSLTSQVHWIDKPSFSQLVYYYAKLNGRLPLPRSTSAGIILFGGPILLYAWRVWRNGQETNGRLPFLALFAFLPVLVTFVASLVARQSVWAERELIIVAAPYLMLAATGVWQLRWAGARAALAVLTMAWAGSAGVVGARAHEQIPWDRLVANIDAIEGASHGSIPIYVLEPFVKLPLEYYLEPTVRTEWFQVERAFQLRLIKDLDEAHGRHFWVVYRDTTWPGPQSPSDVLRQKGYRVGEPLRTGTVSQTIYALPVGDR
jgi:hypothetical protein